jgi:hypothetical protein
MHYARRASGSSISVKETQIRIKYANTQTFHNNHGKYGYSRQKSAIGDSIIGPGARRALTLPVTINSQEPS